MTIIEALEKVEQAAQGNARLEALASVADVPGLRGIVKMAVDDSITFGVKKLPNPSPAAKTLCEIFAPAQPDEEWLSASMELLTKLASREMSGHTALTGISIHLGQCGPLQRKWLERILLKDLRLNIGTKDVNKVIPGLCFEFSVPLATDYAKVKEKDLRGEWIAQYKYDGARCVAYLYGDGTGRVELKSRNGKPWGNFESVRLALAGWNAGRKGPDVVLDGEVVALDGAGKPNFNFIAQNMHAHKREEVGKLQYVVFDYATRDQWEGRESAGDYGYRYENASDLVFSMHDDGVDEGKVVCAPPLGTLTDPTPDDLRALNERAVNDGYEGAMVRLAASTLELKRTKKLLKVKAFSDAEGLIVDTVEGTGKLVGSLGTLVCMTADGIQFEVGSGYTEAQRAELWAGRESLMGKSVKYKYFELSKDGVPRFPIYLGIRHEADK